MKTRTCKSCRFFKIVYEQCGYRFIYSVMYPHYYCTECEQLTDRENVCGKWQRKKAEYDVSPQRLEEVEQDIKALIECLNCHFE